MIRLPRPRPTNPFKFRVNTFHTFDRSIFRRNWKNINEGPLKRAGLLVRKIWVQSIRVDRSLSQRPSKPGRPPKSRHPARPFKRIFSVPMMGVFGTTGVIVGHVGFRPGNQTPMEIHEFGQKITIRAIDRKKTRNLKARQRRALARRIQNDPQLREKIRKNRKKADISRKTITMPERPHARPALEKGQNKLPALWRGSVSRSSVRN